MGEATIRDVARKAQVSVASVSRALNGLDHVSEQTRAKVAAAARDLGYVPHAGARSLSLARTNAIGVLLPDVHGEFFSEIVRGMDVEANRRGYLLLLANMHAGSAQAKAALQAMRGRVDALVVMAPHLDRAAISRALPPASRAVLINAPANVRSHSNIRIDNHAGVRAVIKHLKAIGRSRMVYVGGPSHNLDAQERAAAFASASSADERILASGDFSVESGNAAVRGLIEAGERFDAVFAANDMMAIGAIQALRAAGLRMPEDVAVAGFDDVPLAEHLELTTVRVRIAELGARALSRLITMLENGAAEPVSELHSPELVIRRSTVPNA